MKPKFKQAFMDAAERFAQLSYAQRLKVGCIIVKEDRIISIGYNGMPTGWENDCEEYHTTIDNDGNQTIESTTKPEVLHAESNAIAKLARSPESGNDAAIFVTHSPCINCAKLIYQSGITAVYYRNDYRDPTGLEFLRKCDVTVEQV